MVESGGGILQTKFPPVYRDYSIRLAVPGERTILINRDMDIFDYNYIVDCVKQKSLVSNLNDYIIGKSAFESYNALDILCATRKWSEIHRVEVGERVSDIEDEEEATEPVKRRGNMFKSNRMAYCRKEQERIVQWIIENKGYNYLRGNLLWKKMERDEVGRGRSYQSLKEHFRKVIITQIHTFKLSKDIVDNFQVGMGLKEDDIVKSRITLNTSEKIHQKSAQIQAQGGGKDIITFRPESSQDTSTHKSEVVIERPSITVPAQQPNTLSPLSKSKTKIPIPPRNDVLDNLLNSSSLNEEGGSEISSRASTELEDKETNKGNARDRKRLRQFPLYSDRPLDSPCDPNTPFTLQRRRKTPAGQIDPPPTSTQAFTRDLRQARGSADTFEDEDMGLTSTQNFSEDDEAENEVFVNNSLSRSAQESFDEFTSKNRNSNEQSSLKTVEAELSAMKKCDVNMVNNGLCQEDLEMYYGQLRTKDNSPCSSSLSCSVTTPPPGPSRLPEITSSIPRHRRVTSVEEEDLPASQNLLERHLADHEKYSQSQVGPVQSCDLVDALNNVTDDNKENEGDNEGDDEVSFRSPGSPDRGYKRNNQGFLPPSPLRRKRSNENPISWETSTIKSGRFYNEGSFGTTFRIAFNATEEKAIVNFFLDKGGYHLRKGNKIWKSMQAHNTCPHRTWQSMKARWDKFLSLSLAKYKVTEEDLTAADQRIYGVTGNEPSIDVHMDRRSVSTRTGSQRRTYTREEDVKIIKHLLQNRRHLEVKGREMWGVRYTI